MHEQRLADAAGASPQDDSTEARPETPVLELSSIPIWSPEEAMPIPGLGAGVAPLQFLGAASNRPRPPDARTVNFKNCCVRQSPIRNGTEYLRITLQSMVSKSLPNSEHSTRCRPRSFQ